MGGCESILETTLVVVSDVCGSVVKWESVRVYYLWCLMFVRVLLNGRV